MKAEGKDLPPHAAVRPPPAGLTTAFASTYPAQVSLPGALSLEAIADYGRPATGPKYVIIPNRTA